MKLSTLRRMAADTLDRQQSGDETAADELHAYCVANLDDVLETIGAPIDDGAREKVRHWTVTEFPKALLNTCEAYNVKERASQATRLAKTSAVHDAANKLGSTVALDGIAYVLDQASLLALVKAARPSDWLYFGIDGYQRFLRVPARALKDLHKVHKLTSCTAHMTSPVYGEWRLIVQWGTRGYYQSRVQHDNIPKHDTSIPITLPSMTTMVSRELGVEAA